MELALDSMYTALFPNTSTKSAAPSLSLDNLFLAPETGVDRMKL